MVTITDVLAHISEVSGGYSGVDPYAAIEEYWLHYPYTLRLAITTDVEETELKYLELYGQSDTVYFRLRDYEHGKQLAAELFYVITGMNPNMEVYTGELFNPDDALYLFVYIQK
jgi:hypothetical protein